MKCKNNEPDKPVWFEKLDKILTIASEKTSSDANWHLSLLLH